ncbi:MAG: ankyrin repeat domain-containing protein [Gammaproteobacteria bacterium]|nr:ankyrin repeat domain-containing protein [Gammaproteobacteria bacterium]
MAKYLVIAGADVNTVNISGSTIFFEVAKKNNFKLIQFFVEWGKKLNVILDDYLSAVLIRAIDEYKDLDMIKYLVSAGADVNRGYKDSYPIHRAVMENNLEVVNYLIMMGGDLNVKDSRNETTLHKAVRCNNFAMAVYLVTAGLNVYANKLHNAISLINSAIRHKNLDMVKYLLNIVGNINQCYQDDTGASETPLAFAARENNFEVVKYLVSLGADVNAYNKHNRYESPLYGAVKNNNFEMVEYLLKEGADINPCYQNAKGSFTTPLVARAVIENHFEMVKYLITKGANVNAYNQFTPTALCNVVKNNNFEMVGYLLKKGADINLSYNNGIDFTTALGCAALKNNFKMVKYLINAGANVNACSIYYYYYTNHTTFSPFTALYSAARNNNFEIVNYLLKLGSEPHITEESGNKKMAYEVATHLEVKKLLQAYPIIHRDSPQQKNDALIKEKKILEWKKFFIFEVQESASISPKFDLEVPKKAM